MNGEVFTLGVFAAIILWLMAFSYEIGKKKGLKTGKAKAYEKIHNRLEELK